MEADLEVLSSDNSHGAAPDPALAALVFDVYQSAAPEVRNRMLTQLVGKVYETAPPDTRSLLLERLLRPLGLLALVTVANGIFAKICLRGEWPQFHINVEDVQRVQVRDVLALTDYVLQVSDEALSGLSGLVSASPVLAGSAAAAVLVTALLRRNHARRATDFDD